MKIEDLLVVVVLYNIDYSKSTTCISLEKCILDSGEKLEILLYDNSISESSNNYSNVFNVVYMHDPNNSGVSKAYNSGAKLAATTGKKYLLFLDQDSVLEKDFLKQVIETINSNPGRNIFSPFVCQKQNSILISPSKYKNFRGEFLELKSNTKYLKLENLSMINSGMVISLELFDDAGGFNELIKLDFSDHEFIHRVSKVTSRLIMIPAIISHSLSIFEDDSLESDLFRYGMYLDGGRVFSKNINKYPVFLYVSLGRCVLLTLKTRSIGFFKLFFSSILKR